MIQFIKQTFVTFIALGFLAFIAATVPLYIDTETRTGVSLATPTSLTKYGVPISHFLTQIWTRTESETNPNLTQTPIISWQHLPRH